MGLFTRLFGSPQGKADAAPAGYRQHEAYAGMRAQVLQLTAAALHLPARPHVTIAAMMETAHAEAVASLVTIAGGSASVYFSTGGGIIGRGEHESVRAPARAFLDLAAASRAELQATDSFPLPRPKQVRFYLVTTDGVLTGEAPEDAVGHMVHPLFPLFHSGHAVIAAMRQLGAPRSTTPGK
jgi:hypothetical protein